MKKIYFVIALFFTVSIFGLFLHVEGGGTWRFSPEYNSRGWSKIIEKNYGLSVDCDFDAAYVPSEKCRHEVLGSESQYLLWGDSFAMHLAQALIAADMDFAQATKSGCPPILNYAPVYPKRSLSWSEDCLEFNQSVISNLKSEQKFRGVIISSSLDQLVSLNLFDGSKINSYSSEQTVDLTLQSLKDISSLGYEIHLVTPMVQADYNVPRCLMVHESGVFSLSKNVIDGCVITRGNSKDSRAMVEAYLAALLDQFKFTSVVDISSVFCKEDVCNPLLDGTVAYRDHGHLSINGSKTLQERNDIFGNLKTNDW